MTDRTFTFEEVKQIYEAGIRRGESAQSAYDWGCGASGGKWDEAIDAIVEMVDGDPDSKDYNNYAKVAAWFKDA